MQAYVRDMFADHTKRLRTAAHPKLEETLLHWITVLRDIIGRFYIYVCEIIGVANFLAEFIFKKLTFGDLSLVIRRY